MSTSQIEILPGISPKAYFPDAKHIIQYCFSIGDRHFFKYDDLESSLYHRPLMAQVYMTEIEMRLDAAYMDAHNQAMDAIIARQNIGIQDWSDVIRLHSYLKQRRALPPLPDSLYKYASVIFFDQYESPSVYEFKYGEQKIKFWKEQVSASEFFFMPTLVSLLPFIERFAESSDMFIRMLQVSQKVDQLQTLEILPFLSEEQKIALLSSRQSLENA